VLCVTRSFLSSSFNVLWQQDGQTRKENEPAHDGQMQASGLCQNREKKDAAWHTGDSSGQTKGYEDQSLNVLRVPCLLLGSPRDNADHLQHTNSQP